MEIPRTWSLLAGLCLALLSASAQAQSPEETRRAREAYAQGQAQFRDGDFAEAQEAFERAYRLVPNPVVLLSIAEAQFRQGKYAKAEAAWERYLEERPDAPDRAQVELQLEEVRKRPATLTVQSTPPGAIVSIDGEDTGSVTPAELTLPAGEHTVEVRGVDGQTKRAIVDLAIGEKRTLDVQLEGAPEPAPAEPPAADGAPAEEPLAEPAAEPLADVQEDPGRVRKAAWASVGVAGAGVVMGSVLGGLALKEQKDFDESPSTARADRGERLAIFADVGFGVAIAGALTAVVLFTTERTRGESPDVASASKERRTRLLPLVGRGGGGLGAQVQF